ncbi:two-component regulator propeller domain-containing protein [Paraflavitalea speifideaquila]|uniref:two-component regulator propeller domain-containing protein n=1 Tax=Paraflavitalea speifideaquila TaxID=3076558 RepID=UPI0028E19BD7|nr:two-component regulator propeller domain-containing protein [Paraflavitalea speifideiaquila]
MHVLREDADGNIWVGTRHYGVWKYQSDKDNFLPCTSVPGSYPTVAPLLGSNSSVLSIEPSINNDSIIWAGTVGGLQEINRFTGSVKWHVFPQKDKDYQVAVNAVRRMHHHSDGLLYLGGWTAGLHVFDPATGILQPVPVSKRWGIFSKPP